MSSYSGWGVYGLNLLLAWAARADIAGSTLMPVDRATIDLDPLETRLIEPALRRSEQAQASLEELRGRRVMTGDVVLHDINNEAIKSKPLDVDLRGRHRVGVPFIDRMPSSPGFAAELSEFDFLVAGSTWNRDLLRRAGLDRVELILQGVDTSQFHPAPRRFLFPGRFVVFSGGKLEFRKGQDLVVQAFRIFGARHPDALLMTAWASPWPGLAATLTQNPALKPPYAHADGRVDASGWAVRNGIPVRQLLTLGAVPNSRMARVMREADVALFPNRAEGGTNLVAMECMACGVPVILSANTGHLDLIADDRCVPLRYQAPVAEHEGWGVSDVDEIVAALEWAYAERDAAARLGQNGAAFMSGLTWRGQMNRLGDLLVPLLR